MQRPAVFAGQFYAADQHSCLTEVQQYMSGAATTRPRKSVLVMCPHAGHQYSGNVAGKTLGEAQLAPTVILLGPNHTGRGAPLALWDKGTWTFPGGQLAVDEDLAARFLAAESALSADTLAHIQEHSLEVLLPFLWCVNPEMTLVPVAVGDPRPQVLAGGAARMAECIKNSGRDVSIVVSSDMNHFLSDSMTRKSDERALERIKALDPMGLYGIVRAENISMCGVLPMTLGLQLARMLGAEKAEVVAYATSGEVNGDMQRVVGYAGVIAE